MSDAWHLGYALHMRPFRNHRGLGKVFSREQGIITGVVHGAYPPKKPVALPLFTPLQFVCRGHGELKTIAKFEVYSGCYRLSPSRVQVGFYCNELLYRLLKPEDPHVGLFDAYEVVLSGLRTEASILPVLCEFEKRLLGEVGFGIPQREWREEYYAYCQEEGLVPSDKGVSRQTLEAIGSSEWSDAVVVKEARRLFYRMIHGLLGQEELRSISTF